MALAGRRQSLLFGYAIARTAIVRHVSSVARSFRIIERLLDNGGAASHGELSRQLAIPKATLSGLLAQLSELGYVQLENAAYVPGPALLALGFRATRSENLRSTMRPVLARVAQETGETASLSIEVGRQGDTAGSVLGIDYVEGTNPLRYVGEIGLPQPMHGSAAGRALLAFSNRTATSLPRESLVRYTPRTLTEREQLDAELRRARQRGFAMIVGERWEHLTSVAAPVLDANGEPFAAVTVTGPTLRLPNPEQTVWPVLQRALADLVPASTTATA
jgi:IclR family acetate operon transcriptional repressor